MPWITQGSWALWMPEGTTVPISARYYITTQISQTSTSQITFPQYASQTATLTQLVAPMFSMNNITNRIHLEEYVNHCRSMPPPSRPPAEAMSQLTAAENKARELLLRHLDREQKNDYEKGFFIVISQSRRRYRIEMSSFTANILRLDDREVFCIHGDHSLPMSDHFIAQKLMIEYDEETFLAIANRHGRRG